MWKAAEPTPALDVIAQATARPRELTPSAAMIPPTSAAPVSASVSTAIRRYPGGGTACPSSRAMIWCRAARTAALRAAGIVPAGLGTTVIRESAAASTRAICSVRSAEGPTASTTSISPG